MIKWFKRIKHIMDFYDADRLELEQRLNQRIKYLEDLLVEQTTAGVNIGYRNPSYVIIMGQHKQHDIVEIFTMPSNDFTNIVYHLRELEKHSRAQIVDAPIGIRTVLKRGVEDW